MSISNNEIIKVITSLDDINPISEFQQLLQTVVHYPAPNDVESSKRVYLMCELYLQHTTPLLQNLTSELLTLQHFYKSSL